MKYLGIDFGSKTIGLASGQGSIAFSWKTLRFQEHDFDCATKLLLTVINEYQPNFLVFGYPINMDGSIGESAKTVLAFIENLKLKLNKDIEIVLQDERRTTRYSHQLMLEANLSRKKRKEHKDQLAASIILQTYFDKKNRIP